jgi:alpha-glucosidase
MLNLRTFSVALTLLLVCSVRAAETKPVSIKSPNGRIVVRFQINQEGSPGYNILLNGKPALQQSRLGLLREDADFSKGLTLTSKPQTGRVRDQYELVTSKRRHNNYIANQSIFHLQTSDGKKMDIIFQVSNDGAAFRYFFPETDAKVHKLNEEVSSFHFLPGTRAWLQPMSTAKSGWERTNPSYEEYYEKDIPVGKPSTFGAGWIYPALFKSEDTWLLISETALPRNYCGTRLRSTSPDGEYSVGFADPRETFRNGPSNPESNLPWLTSWRIIVIGSLKTVVESTLGVDLADKPITAKIKPAPGRASWSWPLMGDPNTNYEVQKRFIDYAANMSWEYCLIDALWDKQIGYEKVKELVDYARSKSVKILLWYNSAGDWNGAFQTPRERMLTSESRKEEFEKLKAMGVAGLKVDFFGGDGQSVINYYHDILTDSAKYGLMMNFHGATLPRGWQRTYPHLMTVEAIRGLEFVTFDQRNADQEPSHAAMLPFTRNVFDPMDFTPVVLDKINRIQRRTSSAFELALSVLFTSGIQHFAEIPEGMAKTPEYVKDFLRHVPAVWDDVKFLDGEPGKYAVIARKSGNRWYIAGVNGENAERKITLNLKALNVRRSGKLITDGDGGNLSFLQETVKPGSTKKVQLTLKPHGGFVMVFE